MSAHPLSSRVQCQTYAWMLRALLLLPISGLNVMAADTANPEWNGDFEEGIAGWMLSNGASLQGRVDLVNMANRSGRSLRLSPSMSNRTAERPLEVVRQVDALRFQGRTIFLSANLVAVGGARGAIRLTVWTADGSFQSVQMESALDPSQGPQERSLSIPIDAVAIVVECVASGGSGHAYFDDVRISDEPQTPDRGYQPAAWPAAETLIRGALRLSLCVSRSPRCRRDPIQPFLGPDR